MTRAYILWGNWTTGNDSSFGTSYEERVEVVGGGYLTVGTVTHIFQAKLKISLHSGGCGGATGGSNTHGFRSFG